MSLFPFIVIPSFTPSRDEDPASFFLAMVLTADDEHAEFLPSFSPVAEVGGSGARAASRVFPRRFLPLFALFFVFSRG